MEILGRRMSLIRIAIISGPLPTDVGSLGAGLLSDKVQPSIASGWTFCSVCEARGHGVGAADAALLLSA